MKHLLNTLYITTQGSYLAREGETVLVRVEQETKLQLPIHTIGSIIVSGRFLAVLFCLVYVPSVMSAYLSSVLTADLWLVWKALYPGTCFFGVSNTAGPIILKTLP